MGGPGPHHRDFKRGGSVSAPPIYRNRHADVHRRIVGAGYFRGLGLAGFAQSAGKIIGDVNDVHPFREGNGRVQAQYLKRLAERAGHRLDLTKLDPASWIEASRQAHKGEYEPMAQTFRAALVERDRSQADELQKRLEDFKAKRRAQAQQQRSQRDRGGGRERS